MSTPARTPIRLITAGAADELYLSWKDRFQLTASPQPLHPAVVELPSSARPAAEQALTLKAELIALLHLPFTADLPGSQSAKSLWHFHNNLSDSRLRLSIDLGRVAAAGDHHSVVIPTLNWRIGRIVLPMDVTTAVDACHRLRGIGYTGYVVTPASLPPSVKDHYLAEVTKALNPPPPAAKPTVAKVAKVAPASTTIAAAGTPPVTP